MTDEHAPSPTEPTIHNSVLMRERAPHERDHQWVMILPLVAVIVAGAGFWAYLQAHPAGPVVNHAVAAAPTTPSGVG